MGALSAVDVTLALLCVLAACLAAGLLALGHCARAVTEMLRIAAAILVDLGDEDGPPDDGETVVLLPTKVDRRAA